MKKVIANISVRARGIAKEAGAILLQFVAQPQLATLSWKGVGKKSIYRSWKLLCLVSNASAKEISAHAVLLSDADFNLPLKRTGQKLHWRLFFSIRKTLFVFFPPG